ncbi:MAG: glycosyltransferase [Acidobacteriota bacterium]
MAERYDDVTVIVPTLGRPILGRTLAALADGSHLPRALVLADQGVEPATAQLVPIAAAGIEVTHLRFSPAGPATARNRAVEQVTTRWLVAVDDDCVPADEWLERMMDRLRGHPEAIVTGRIAAPERDAASISTPSLLDAPVERIHRRPSVGPDPLHTGSFGVAVEVARRIGPFDETLVAAEDNDWGWRALRLGVPIVTAPDVVVTHEDGRDDAERLAVERRYASGQGRFYGKHLRRLDGRIAWRIVRDLARAPLRWLRGIVRGDDVARASGRIWMVELPRGVVAGLVGGEDRRPWGER